MRIAAIIEYNGAAFSGWQIQSSGRTVQGCVEQALAKVADRPIRVTVAGRTDAGVHAIAQVFHFNIDVERSDYAWVHGTNSNLPTDVALLWAGRVDEKFHARFSATGRRYEYLILNRTIRPAMLAGRVTHEYRPLDVQRMREGAKYLIGTHDFSSFRSANCQAGNPVRELHALQVQRDGDRIRIYAHANAFLQHMVRNIAGVLIDIGAGERAPDWAGAVLEARDRRVGGATAPPDGLYLTAIDYPQSAKITRLLSGRGLW